MRPLPKMETIQIEITNACIAVQKGCDGVDPDNVDGYTNKTGFPLTAKDQLAYNKFLAQEATHQKFSYRFKE